MGFRMTWRATVLTLFPEMFPGPLGVSLAGKGLASGLWSIEARDIRASATDKHRSVDDTPAGGGPGMVLRADVLATAIDSADIAQDRPRLLMSPRGRPLTQSLVKELAAGPGPLIVCGRFEGVDQRVIEARDLRGDLDRRLRAVRRRNRRDGADRRLRAAVAGGDGQTGLRRGRKLFRWTTGIPAIYPAAGVRGPRHPGNPRFRRSRQGRGLAAGRSRGADPGAAAGSMGDQARPKRPQKARQTGDKRGRMPYTSAKSAQWQDRWTSRSPRRARRRWRFQ